MVNDSLIALIENIPSVNWTPEGADWIPKGLVLSIIRQHEAEHKAGADAVRRGQDRENGQKSVVGANPASCASPSEMLDTEVERILAMPDDEIIAEVGGEGNANVIASQVRRVFDKAQMQVKIAEAIHYPRCWDTAAYPTLFDALYEMAGCCGCSECKYAGKNPDADQKPTVREISKDFDLTAARLDLEFAHGAKAGWNAALGTPKQQKAHQEAMQRRVDEAVKMINSIEGQKP